MGIPQICTPCRGEVWTGQSHFKNDIQDAHWQHIARDSKNLQLLQTIGAPSIMAVPLLARGQVIGAITFGTTESGRRFSAEDLAWAEEIARRAAVAVDFARLFAAEHRARATAESFAAQREAVLNQIVDGVVMCDVAGRITYVNHAARRLGIMAELGTLVSDPRRVEHLRTTKGEPFRPQDLPLVRAGRGEVVVGDELILEEADGKEVAVRCSASPVRTSDGSMLGAVLVLHDVTAWRDVGRQKDQFFANASHDLRTPLTTTRAAIELVLANEPPGTPDLVHQLFLNIDGATDRMSRLVEDLLELTRLQEGWAHLHLDRCDVRVPIMNSLRAIEPLTKARGQHLQSNLPSGDLWITADVERLERALFNLLDNAHKYTPPGGQIALTVEAQRSTVIISVADDGPGIPADEQQHIFERFYRLERTRRNAGTGLGLPIVRAVVELHGGRLWVESAPGRGSTFFVALPVSAAAATLPQGQQR
jgi:two-component system, OmpR family, phosphate regulon sensor histidine kinase PhoR